MNLPQLAQYGEGLGLAGLFLRGLKKKKQAKQRQSASLREAA
jgi:hypothetical protein